MLEAVIATSMSAAEVIRACHRLGVVCDVAPIFATSLSADILDEYLDRLPEDVVAEARQRAIATACRYPDVHQSLHLLAELSPDIAADLVHRRLGEIRGEAYWACDLSPSASQKVTR
jgi:hypothetical protein